MKLQTLVLAVAITGCGGDSPTEPPPTPLSLAISSEVTETRTNGTKWECFYTLTVRAVGNTPGEYALWESIEWTFRTPDGEFLLRFFGDTSDLVDLWDSDRVIGGQTKTAQRIANYPELFDLWIVFRYRIKPSGELRSETIFVNCG